jgi:hypothetical protein
MRRQRKADYQDSKLVELRQMASRQPFRAFRIHISSGWQVPVSRAEDIHVEPERGRVTVFLPELVAVFGPNDIAAVAVVSP